MDIKSQVEDIDPSAKDPLFRRLMIEEDLGYLRDDDGIIGFELDLQNSSPLLGYAVIGIQKHTILCYKSDLKEKPCLVLFPATDKLFDESFGLLNLTVTKKHYNDSSFKGKVLEHGIFKDVVADLTPPQKEVDLPPGVSEAMVEAMLDANTEAVRSGQEKLDKLNMVKEPVTLKDASEAPAFTPEPVDELPSEPVEEPPFIDEPVNDAPNISNNKQDIIKKRIDDMRAQNFTSISDVSDYAVLHHNVPKDIATQVVSNALQATHDSALRVEIAIRLFEKIYDKLL